MVKQLEHGHFQAVTAACYSPATGEAFSAGLDGTLVVWSEQGCSRSRGHAADVQVHEWGPCRLVRAGDGSEDDADAWSDDPL